LFYEALTSGKFIPAGRILANARENSPMKNYNNCFTIDINDSMTDIYESLKEDALISKMGGGVGFDISKLRPKGQTLSGGGESSGPVSFLRIFDQSAKTIMTGGQRRSAHIALMDISHPDIEEFITAKQGDQNKELTQFNISVKIPDAFIDALNNDEDWNLVFDGKIYKTVKARDLYTLLAKNAFTHNEPGIFYSDKVEQFNNGYWAFKLDRVNPCGELVMPAYSLCCLGALNLTRFVIDPFSDKARFDHDGFSRCAATGVRFLDNVLERTSYPLEKIETNAKKWRRIGLGFTGLGDLFAMMGIVYGSSTSVKLAGEIAQKLRDASYIASCELAKERGTFPGFNKEKYLKANFIKELPKHIRDMISTNGIRNIQLNTVAPTGTISLSVGQNCSSGIEPIFSLEYTRHIRNGSGTETKPEKVLDYAWLLYKKIFGDSTVPQYFVTAPSVDPYASIDIQSAVQKYIDHSISKTLNLPRGTKFDDYQKLFLYAHKKGLKGFTTFNPDGSMKGILESDDRANKEKVHRRYAPNRPKELPCIVHKLKQASKTYIIITGFLNNSLYEIFCLDDIDNVIQIADGSKAIVRKNGKASYDLIQISSKNRLAYSNFTRKFASPDSSLARFISMALRHGTPLQFVINQLSRDTSFADFERVLVRILKKYINNGEEVISGVNECPECNDNLVFRDGCVVCPSCGWSSCL
ncbi:MAG TPA: adenosylcobalamin-dependent ribonucleoside-diphosphate reductase, partial [Spirochaetota bacterium]|nr:adenosylcobalamin-dependent ribonucleoside-diphosphate reductase [Spirochaetota bacterium]